MLSLEVRDSAPWTCCPALDMKRIFYLARLGGVRKVVGPKPRQIIVVFAAFVSSTRLRVQVPHSQLHADPVLRPLHRRVAGGDPGHAGVDVLPAPQPTPS